MMKELKEGDREWADDRRRGFVSYEPTEETKRRFINPTLSILREYREHLPLTVRQIFYRLVSLPGAEALGLKKDDKTYQQLVNRLTRARRGKLIVVSDIRDDGAVFSRGGEHGFDSPADFWRSEVEGLGEGYSAPTRRGQPNVVEVWCEAAGMVPQIERIAYPFGASVASGGGMASVSFKVDAARRIAKRDRPTDVLLITDWDRTGNDSGYIYLEDVTAFAETFAGRYDHEWWDYPSFHRVAVLPEQIEEHNLPGKPANKSDEERFGWHGKTVEAEALPPSVLATELSAALESVTDMGALAETQRQEQEEAEAVEELKPRVVEAVELVLNEWEREQED